MMKNLLWLLFFLAALNASAQTDEIKLDSTLSHIHDIRIISKTVSNSPYRIEYQLSIRQPINHSDTVDGFFYQQLHLIHKGISKPMVMETEGYDGQPTGNEIEKMLDCNDLNVEFRYFNKSKPDVLQWQYLTFEQATADLHHINQVFRAIYPSKWISTGISRGGETALIYRYFFPDDVCATVPYVAPMPNDIEDKRIYAFLDTAGGLSTVNKIRNVQIYLLQHEKEAMQLLPDWVTKLHYSAAGSKEAAFEYTVLEYPFSFWQISNYKPSDIPTNKNISVYFNHLMRTFGGDYIASFSDERGVTPFLPHCYMTWQTGYYKYNIVPFKNYLHFIKGPNPTAALLPPSVPRKPYDPGFEQKVNTWLANKGNNIIYIYGGRDTWTACKAEFNPGVNAKLFIVPHANHFEARVKNMPHQMQLQFIAALKTMTGLNADVGTLK